MMMVGVILLSMMGFAATPRTPTACDLLSKHDIAKVQGARYRSTKLTETKSKGLEVSQCFYALPHLNESISVDLIRGNARAFWKRHFEEQRVAERERGEEHENNARHVDGVGDAAVWSGNRFAGALYVLKGETVLRISVGGAGTEEQKIEKSRTLALRALRRISG